MKIIILYHKWKALEQLDNIQLITYVYTPTPSHSILAPDPGWVEECTHSLTHSLTGPASKPVAAAHT